MLYYAHDKMDSYEHDSCIRGYHIYQNIWNAEVDEHFICEREPLNPSDRYAVAVLKDDVVVGHLPRHLSRILSLFLLKDSTIDCVVIGGRRYSSDLPQGGLEIPCKLIFNGKRDDIKKLKHLLACKAPAFSSI